jgi:hypothetical protein
MSGVRESLDVDTPVPGRAPAAPNRASSCRLHGPADSGSRSTPDPSPRRRCPRHRRAGRDRRPPDDPRRRGGGPDRTSPRRSASAFPRGARLRDDPRGVRALVDPGVTSPAARRRGGARARLHDQRRGGLAPTAPRRGPAVGGVVVTVATSDAGASSAPERRATRRDRAELVRGGGPPVAHPATSQARRSGAASAELRTSERGTDGASQVLTGWTPRTAGRPSSVHVDETLTVRTGRRPR